jgi:pimeloyl-ACP methyl ester carboxylesterase
MSLPGGKIEVNGLSLHVADQGSGPAVLLLHGFPDSSSLWRKQVPALVEAGYRAVTPDLRGFGESARPGETEAYSVPAILSDVTGILDALGIERPRVVCHDWGAAIGWALAMYLPARVDRLVAMSVGHPGGFQTGMEQREKSWYMLLFQFEEIAEELLRRDDWRFFREFARDHPEVPSWIRDLERPGALTSALSWYRANVHPRMMLAEGPPPPKVEVPVLGIWSSGDAYLTEAQMVASADWVTGPWRYERIEDASHWLQLDRPDRINALLLDFLKD